MTIALLYYMTTVPCTPWIKYMQEELIHILSSNKYQFNYLKIYITDYKNTNYIFYDYLLAFFL